MTAIFLYESGAMAELKKILYAEDDPDIQVIAKMALETVGGFELCVCNSGSEAVENAVGFAPDLILLDVMMPGMDGPTAMQEIQKDPALAGIPVVFMTAKVMPSDIAGYKALGATDVISKPFDPMALPEQIREIWSGHNG